MDATPLASDDIKASIAAAVNWYLADKLKDATVSIATKKYLTPENLLVYLTVCSVAEPAIARVKIQVLSRVSGGVHESIYQLYADNRFERSNNDMIFGSTAGANPTVQNEPVTQPEADTLYGLITSLQTARQTL